MRKIISLVHENKQSEMLCSNELNFQFFTFSIHEARMKMYKNLCFLASKFKSNYPSIIMSLISFVICIMQLLTDKGNQKLLFLCIPFPLASIYQSIQTEDYYNASETSVREAVRDTTIYKW